MANHISGIDERGWLVWGAHDWDCPLAYFARPCHCIMMIFSDPVDQNPKGHLPGIFIVTMLWKLATKENTDLDLGTVVNMLLFTYKTRHLMRINAGDPRQRTYFWWIWKKRPRHLPSPPSPEEFKKRGAKNLRYLGLYWKVTESVEFWQRSKCRTRGVLNLLWAKWTNERDGWTRVRGRDGGTEGRGRRRFGDDRLSSSEQWSRYAELGIMFWNSKLDNRRAIFLCEWYKHMT